MVDIIVLVKQMPDLEQIKADPSTGEPMIKNVPLKMETLSENAIEAAVQVKEKNGGKVTAIIFGDTQSSSIMKKAYAMGVDEGYVITGYAGNNPPYTAKVLADKISKIKHDLVILGNQSADSITGLLSGMISKLLAEPLLGNASSIEISSGVARIRRILEDRTTLTSAKMPAIISVTQEINQPRLPAVMQILAAGRKPIKTEPTPFPHVEYTKILSNRA
ncbi:MAG: electron transfer flavoprotein subunit beta/FixA family protein, partial [Thermoplasmataceae archaeon]